MTAMGKMTSTPLMTFFKGDSQHSRCQQERHLPYSQSVHHVRVLINPKLPGLPSAIADEDN